MLLEVVNILHEDVLNDVFQLDFVMLFIYLIGIILSSNKYSKYIDLPGFEPESEENHMNNAFCLMVDHNLKDLLEPGHIKRYFERQIAILYPTHICLKKVDKTEQFLQFLLNCKSKIVKGALTPD